MSGVLHPVGPEPAATYWLRRALVLGVAAVVAAIALALMAHGRSAQQAVPAGPPAATPTVDATPSILAPVPAGRGSASTEMSASPADSTSAASPRGKHVENQKTGSKQPTTCDPARLRTTLTGKETLQVQHSSTFELSLINGSVTNCWVSVSSSNFELRIQSGRDRIWSSSDCSKAVKRVYKKLSSEQAVTWQMTWDGGRSAGDCRNRPKTPQPGTYIATAQLKGANPVQLRMILHG